MTVAIDVAQQVFLGNRIGNLKERVKACLAIDGTPADFDHAVVEVREKRAEEGINLADFERHADDAKSDFLEDQQVLMAVTRAKSASGAWSVLYMDSLNALDETVPLMTDLIPSVVQQHPAGLDPNSVPVEVLRPHREFFLAAAAFYKVRAAECETTIGAGQIQNIGAGKLIWDVLGHATLLYGLISTFVEITLEALKRVGPPPEPPAPADDIKKDDQAGNNGGKRGKGEQVPEP